MTSSSGRRFLVGGVNWRGKREEFFTWEEKKMASSLKKSLRGLFQRPVWGNRTSGMGRGEEKEGVTDQELAKWGKKNFSLERVPELKSPPFLEGKKKGEF